MWEVLLKGDINGGGFELSVVRSDNEFGKRSWGWGGMDKIVLFGDAVYNNRLHPRTPENVAFALSTAQMLCDTLNAKA